MAQIYSLGSDQAKATAEMAELLKTVPKMEHKYPNVPTSYTVKQMQMSDDVEEKILAASEKSKMPPPLRYCRTCFSFSRDLSLFSNERERLPAETGEYIHWKASLRDLASATERRCSFCSFMACRFFNDTGLLSFWTTGIEEPKPPLGCCALDEAEVSKVKEAIVRLRSLEERYPDGSFTLIIQPTDYSLEEQSYTKLLFLAARSNTGEAGVKEILGFRRDIVVEIYNHPGALTTLQPF
jgi:hypothetical protein